MRRAFQRFRRPGLLSGLVTSILLSVFAAGPLRAQAAQAKPLTLESILSALRDHVGSPRLLDLATAQCITFRVDDEAARQIRDAGGTPELVAGLREACFRSSLARLPARDRIKVPGRRTSAPPARPDTLQSAFEAIVMSALIPGGGQMEIGRIDVGALFLAGAIGSAVAVLYTPDVENQRTGEGEVRHPYRSIGAAAYVLLSITSAIDAHAAVNRHNKAVLARGRQNAVSLQPPAISITPSAVQMEVLRVTF